MIIASLLTIIVFASLVIDDRRVRVSKTVPFIDRTLTIIPLLVFASR